MERPASISIEMIEIANPCPASWEKMRGDERVRFCEQCQLQVYNLSELPRQAAVKLLSERGETRGRLCVRIYKRADGTVITADCGGGLRAAAKRAAKFASAAAALVLGAALAPVMLGASSRYWENPTVSASADPLAVLKAWIAPFFPQLGIAPPSPRPTMGTMVVTGDVATTPRHAPATQPSATQPSVPPQTLQGGISPPPGR